MTPYITIGKRKIGKGRPVYVIAEMSANHHKDFQTAVDLVYSAKDAGADAIKLQTFTADSHTLDSREPCFMVKGGTAWDGKNLHDLYKECEMPWNWQPKLKDLADDIGIDLFSAAVDPISVAFLEDMGIPVHKVSSFEIVDLNLIRIMAKTGKPIIISTGMATLCEITEAVNAAKNAGGDQLALMKCTSAYPAPMEDMNLMTIPHMSQCFSVPVGISDHTIGSTVPVAAVAMGATLVEKHLTLSRKNVGPDSTFSTEPEEFSDMVKAVRDTEKSLGNVQYKITGGEKASQIFRRSLFVVEEVNEGEVFTEKNIRSIRPGHGIPPKNLDIIIGKKARKAVKKGIPFQWDMI